MPRCAHRTLTNSVEIALGNGRRLTVDVRVDGVALRRLLAVLEAPA